MTDHNTKVLCDMEFRALHEAFMSGSATILECTDEHGNKYPAICSMQLADPNGGDVYEIVPIAVLISGLPFKLVAPESFSVSGPWATA